MVSKILTAIVAIKDILKHGREIYALVRAWWVEYQKQKDRDDVNEGLKENESERIEKAINSSIAGKPSNLDGVQTRSREESQG